MSNPIENCPVEEKPMRDRAYTDRQLLELAAKAAGHIPEDFIGNPNYMAGVLSHWNPLADDGDALRLAVKLQISIVQCGATRLCESVQGHYLSDEVDCKGDGLSATRRAIVRAAAAIAEGAKS